MTRAGLARAAKLPLPVQGRVLHLIARDGLLA
jgi:hypothetical protein